MGGKKIINNATTRAQRLYQKNEKHIREYYDKNTISDTKMIDVELNLDGYTILKKEHEETK